MSSGEGRPCRNALGLALLVASLWHVSVFVPFSFTSRTYHRGLDVVVCLFNVSLVR